MSGQTALVRAENSEFVLRGPTLDGNGNNVMPLVNVQNGTFIMQDGAIINNNTTSAAYGGGVSLHNNSASFVMNGGIISYNRSGYGAGVLVQYGTFTMHGGKITGNIGTGGSGGVALMSGKFYKNDDDNQDGDSGEISGNEFPVGMRGKNINKANTKWIDKDIGPQTNITSEDTSGSPWNEPL